MVKSQLISREPESVWVTDHGWIIILTSVQHMHLQLLVCYTQDQVDVGPGVSEAIEKCLKLRLANLI